jgi:hypothetical protein
MDEWLKMLDASSGGHIYVISLDWEKAFDKIPHSRLILKLKNAGIWILIKVVTMFFVK